MSWAPTRQRQERAHIGCEQRSGNDCIQIYMDDEDNNNHHRGWIGATSQNNSGTK